MHSTSSAGHDGGRIGVGDRVGSYTLDHATIQFSGTIAYASDTNRLTITGGAGSYKAARGTVLTE